MVLSLWGVSDTTLSIPPTQEVFTLEAEFNSDFGPILCDYAWSKKEAAKEHFWYCDQEITRRLISLPFIEYIKRHTKEVVGDNRFLDNARMEFLAEYNERWSKEITTYEKEG